MIHPHIAASNTHFSALTIHFFPHPIRTINAIVLLTFIKSNDSLSRELAPQPQTLPTARPLVAPTFHFGNLSVLFSLFCHEE